MDDTGMEKEEVCFVIRKIALELKRNGKKERETESKN